MTPRERQEELQKILDGFRNNKRKLSECARQTETLRGEGQVLQAALMALVCEANEEESKSIYAARIVVDSGGDGIRLAVEPKDEPLVDDWGELRKHIVENDAWELLSKRVSMTAVRERWQEGGEVPGIRHNVTHTLSIRKLQS